MELEQQVLQVTYKGAKISAEILLALIKTALAARRGESSPAISSSTIAHGEQTMEQLNEHNRQLVNVEISGTDLESIRKELKENGVDFSVRKRPERPAENKDAEKTESPDKDRAPENSEAPNKAETAEVGEYVVWFKAQDIDRVYDGLERCLKNIDLDSLKKSMKEQLDEATKKADERNAGRQQDAPGRQKERVQSL